MSSDRISITPCSPHVGAEIGNIDLTRPLNDGEVAALRDAFVKYGVIFFRDQPLGNEDQMRLAGYFGHVHIHVGGKGTASSPVEGFPAIRRQHFDANSKRISGEVWHSDQSCAEIPPDGSLLIQKILPPHGGGDTLFASAAAAYDALSEPMKAYLEPMTALHDGAKLFDAVDGKVHPRAEHPVITTHPESKRKVLFVNKGFTTRILDVPRDESDAILDFLYDHIAKPHWQMRFRWLPNSVAFWDNRSTQHFAIWDYWPNVRSGNRVQFEGVARPSR
ncbi:MAG: TauD/TfdA family dioxygenase [Hyphomicrobiales bacterium]|nr:TauD/TfdA family dioxygenase [Hyphomicrobiales bacterium]